MILKLKSSQEDFKSETLSSLKLQKYFFVLKCNGK